jgi:site-specific recombinase XerD
LAQDTGDFLIDREARGLNHRTIQFYSDEMRYLRSYLEAKNVYGAHSVTPTHLRQYLLHLSATRNPGGIHAAYSAMRTFYRWCWLEYVIESRNPITKVRPPKVVQQPLEALPLIDLQAMMKTCERSTLSGDRDRAVLFSLLDTGCRASEFVSLNVRDVNLHSGAVLIRAGKGGKARTASVGAKSRREVSRYLRQRKPDVGDGLRLTVRGTRLTYWGLGEVVCRRAEKAGV